MDSRDTGDYKDSTTNIIELVNVLHDAKRLRETTTICTNTMPVVDGVQIEFPNSMVATLPVLGEEGDFLSKSGDPVGAEYQSPAELIRLWGLSEDAATKTLDPCLSYYNDAATQCPIALWPEVIDMDCDGDPGVTARIGFEGTEPSSVQMLRRTRMTRKGEVISASRIEGTIDVVEEQRIIGAEKAVFKFNSPYRALSENSSFVMLRVSDDATCADLSPALFE